MDGREGERERDERRKGTSWEEERNQEECEGRREGDGGIYDQITLYTCMKTAELTHHPV